MEWMHDDESTTQNCAANKEADKESESWWRSIRRGLPSVKKIAAGFLRLLLFVSQINGGDGQLRLYYDGRHTYQWSEANGAYLPTCSGRPFVLNYGNETCFYDSEKNVFIFDENYNMELFMRIFKKKIHASECAHLCKARNNVLPGHFQVVRCKRDSCKLQKMRSYLGSRGATYAYTEMADYITLIYPEGLYGEGLMFIEPYYSTISDLNTVSVLNTVEEEVENFLKPQKRKKSKKRKRKRRT